jgi:large subunit ribosomal protein L10
MRPEKEAIVNEIKERLDGSAFTILLDCRGLSVDQLEDLRTRLDRSHNKLEFFKNTFIKVALEGTELQSLSEHCTGPTAVVFGDGDLAQTARLMRDYRKEHDLPEFKAGSMDHSILDVDQIVQIANLPAREVLLGQAVGTIAAPMTQLVGVLQQKLLSLLYVLKAAQENKGGE